MELFDKVVMITGASSGIGRACAPSFARRGAKVVLLSRSGGELQELAQELQKAGHTALAIPTDVTNRAEVEQAVQTTLQTFGRIDVLVNNAGRAVAGGLAELPLEDYRSILEVNVFGWLNCLQAVVPTMRKQGGGLIISVNSMVSKINIPNLGGYVSSKYALDALGHTARLELLRDNIKVITVYPNMTRTAFFKNTLGAQQNRAARTEMNRERAMQTPEYVAERIIASAITEPRDQYMSRRDKIIGKLSSLIINIYENRITNRQHKRN